MDNETRAWLIGFHKRMSAYHRGKMLEAMNDCPHDIKPSDPDYGVAKCHICNSRYLGWYCPDSENHLCEYPPPSEYQICIHCSEPQERK